MDNLRKKRQPELNDNTEGSKAAFHQYKVSLRATLNEVWLQEWATIQDEYHNRIGSRRSSRVWLIRLSLKIQTLVQKLWLTRDEAIHKEEDSESNRKKH